jgi:haloalkane dehalogenase
VPHYAEQDGLRMHFVDEGEGDPILLLHGEPTWSFLYRKMIAPLAEVARVVAPDYFGFGRSDKPTDPRWYSYDRHAESIARLVVELDLRRLTLVVQDWGGPIGFRVAVENPDRIARLVVLNTGVGVGAPNVEWLRFQAFVRRVGTEIVPGRLVQLTLVRPADDAVIAGYDAPFPVPESRVGVVQFPELVATSADHASAAAMATTRARLAELEVPAFVLFGERDPIFPRSAAVAMAGLLRNAELAPPVADAGHFVQEDAGEAVADAIRRRL